jgi:hypothetical protein
MILRALVIDGSLCGWHFGGKNNVGSARGVRFIADFQQALTYLAAVNVN